jgi:AI-2 transport protein TqsA
MAEAIPSSKKPRASQMVLLFAALVIGVAGLKAAQNFFVPVLLAFFIATVSYPVTDWLRRHRVPRAIAVLLTVLVDFAFLAGVVVLGITIFGDLQQKWETEYYDLTQAKVKETSAQLADTLKNWGVEDAAPKIQAAVSENLSELKNIRFSQVWNVGSGVLGRVVSFFGTSVIVIILTVFMLLEARMFGRRFSAICEARGPNFQRMLSATKDTQRYLGIKTAVSLATGLLAGLLCWAAGLDFFVFWGILAYALNYIPVVGSLIAGLAPTILALLLKGPADAVVVGGGYFLINTFLGNFLEPMLMGRRFGLSTLVVVMSVMFWGWLWGPIGMLMAVPLTMMVKVVLDNNDEFRWIAVAIGQDVQRPAEEVRIIKEGAAEKTELPASAGAADAAGG